MHASTLDPQPATASALPAAAAPGAGPAAMAQALPRAAGLAGLAPAELPLPGHEARLAPPPVAVCCDLIAAVATLDALLGRCRRQARLATVLWVDVVLGDPDAGRSLLQAMGQRLRHRVRATDSVLQVGSEGFMVLLVDAGEQTSPGVRERLEAVLQGPYRVAGGRVAPLMLRVGRAVHGLDGQDAESLLRVAARLGAAEL